MSNLAGKNILVTGATGLVGAHVVERLLSLAPAQIVCLMRSDNSASYFNGKNLAPHTIFAYGDLKDKDRVFDVVTKYEINYIFHIAAQPIVATAFINPYETLASNIMGTVHILEGARQSPYIEGVIVASSDKAYGKECNDATEDQALAGDHPYDVSKSCADLIAQTYAHTYGLPVVVSRFGNIFGPGDTNFNRIIPGLMKAIIKNEELPIRSDGKFVRDYVYVKDVVEGYIVLAENIARVKGHAFNFSSGYNFSVLDLVERVAKILDKKIQYQVRNTQKNEIPAQSLNYAKAEQVLGWRPQYSLEKSVQETFAWYEAYLQGSVTPIWNMSAK